MTWEPFVPFDLRCSEEFPFLTHSSGLSNDSHLGSWRHGLGRWTVHDGSEHAISVVRCVACFKLAGNCQKKTHQRQPPLISLVMSISSLEVCDLQSQCVLLSRTMLLTERRLGGDFGNARVFR